MVARLVSELPAQPRYEGNSSSHDALVRRDNAPRPTPLRPTPGFVWGWGLGGRGHHFMLHGGRQPRTRPTVRSPRPRTPHPHRGPRGPADERTLDGNQNHLELRPASLSASPVTCAPRSARARRAATLDSRAHARARRAARRARRHLGSARDSPSRLVTSVTRSRPRRPCRGSGCLPLIRY